MKLSDPFGRLESRHQLGYESMRDTMRESGITTPEAALDVVNQARKRAMKFLGGGTVVLLLVAGLLPTSIPIVLALELFLIVWAVNSTRTGQQYIQRYIDEDLKGDGKQLGRDAGQ